MRVGESLSSKRARTRKMPWHDVVRSEAMPFMAYRDLLACGHWMPRKSRGYGKAPKRRRCDKCPEVAP